MAFGANNRFVSVDVNELDLAIRLPQELELGDELVVDARLTVVRIDQAVEVLRTVGGARRLAGGPLHVDLELELGQLRPAAKLPS